MQYDNTLKTIEKISNKIGDFLQNREIAYFSI